MKRKSSPYTVSFIVCVAIVFSVFIVEYAERQRYQEVLRGGTISTLSQLRAGLEAGINGNFYLTRGLIAFVATHPEMSQQTFRRWSRNLLRHRNSIINIGLAPNNILTFVHPLKGNENAIGLNYEKNEKQWPAVKAAIEARKTVVAGPVNLVQGGVGFISRTPIFVDTDESTRDKEYWGMASIVIDKEKLLRKAGFYSYNKQIQVALKGADGLGAKGGMIEGDGEIFTQDPVLLDVLLPEGSWQLAAVPVGGWQQPSPNLFLIRGLGAVLVLLFGVGVFVWLRSVNRTQRKIENARLKAEQASQELAKSEAFLNAIIENIPHMIFVKDAQELKFVRFNKAGEELTGFNRQEVLGRTVEQLFPAAGAALLAAQDRQVLAEKRLCDFPQEEIETVHRGIRTFHTKKMPLLDANQEPEFLLGISEDITEQQLVQKEKQKLEQQLHQAQKMEAIGLMAGGVAHDLNNILAAITGYPELLLRKLPRDSEFCKPLQVILDSGKRAVAIVADLLTVAKGVASIRELVSLNRLIEEYLDSPECLNTKKYFPNGTVQTKLASDLRPIMASSVHIKKCLMNLVNNAVEAMRGKGTITLSTWNETVEGRSRAGHQLEDGEYVVLRVDDDGPGISAIDIEHIFEPFYTKKMMGKSGTGLGLAVVWNSVKDHNGRIFVGSGRQGTSFYLYFPASHQPGPEPIDEREQQALAGQGQGQKILVVDDEPHVRDIACQMLESAGYQVVAVGSGEEAVSYVAENWVDLLLIDMLMEPGINGSETYRRIVELKPRQKALIASGFSESEDVKAALRLGASRFINKPYSMAQLCHAVKMVLEEHVGDLFSEEG